VAVNPAAITSVPYTTRPRTWPLSWAASTNT
jgi:hypothetical protein